ncbi:MAG: hypothetical protein ACI4S9_06830, partial [Christensenellales bacterium]
MKGLKITLALILASVLLCLSSCGTALTTPTKEAASLRNPDEVYNPYGNAYRAYSMTKTVIDDYFVPAEGGGRGWQYRNMNPDVHQRSNTADIWNYASFVNAVTNLITLFPEDMNLVSTLDNMIEG